MSTFAGKCARQLPSELPQFRKSRSDEVCKSRGAPRDGSYGRVDLSDETVPLILDVKSKRLGEKHCRAPSRFAAALSETQG